MCRQKYFVEYHFDVNEGKMVDAEFNLKITQAETVVKEENVKLSLVGKIEKFYQLSNVKPDKEFECVITFTKWVATDN